MTLPFPTPPIHLSIDHDALQPTTPALLPSRAPGRHFIPHPRDPRGGADYCNANAAQIMMPPAPAAQCCACAIANEIATVTAIADYDAKRRCVDLPAPWMLHVDVGRGGCLGGRSHTTSRMI